MGVKVESGAQPVKDKVEPIMVVHVDGLKRNESLFSGGVFEHF